jgi:AcrR family transcriptional regulator
VEANQRERILDAIVDVTSLVGYAAMSVEDIIGTAGVSRRTFYDHFKSKEDAFIAALDAVGTDLVERMRSATANSQDFAGCVRSCLGTFLFFLADEPRYADLLIVEAMAAGPAAIERRNKLLKAFSEMLHAGADKVPDGRRPPALTAETIAGGIYEVVYSRVLEGQARQLPSLLPDLTYSVIQPYIGHAAAQRESAKPPIAAAR